MRGSIARQTATPLNFVQSALFSSRGCSRWTENRVSFSSAQRRLYGSTPILDTTDSLGPLRPPSHDKPPYIPVDFRNRMRLSDRRHAYVMDV